MEERGKVSNGQLTAVRERTSVSLQTGDHKCVGQESEEARQRLHVASVHGVQTVSAHPAGSVFLHPLPQLPHDA